jgi:hypothetical protein
MSTQARLAFESRMAMACIMFKNGMRPVHPGEVLLEDSIKPMGVSVRAVAIAKAIQPLARAA